MKPIAAMTVARTLVRAPDAGPLARPAGPHRDAPAAPDGSRRRHWLVLVSGAWKAAHLRG